MGRRGGFSFGSSGGSSCQYCNEPLELEGWNWKSGKVNGLFALTCLAIVIFLVCLGLATQFKWTRHDGRRDTPRTLAYVIATVSVIISSIFNVVDTGLTESTTNTVYLYYLTYIFNDLFSDIASVLILWVILRTVIDSANSKTMHKLSGVNLIATGLVAALVATEFGMYVAQIAFLLEDNSLYGHSDLQRNQYRIILALLSLYLVTTIYAGAIGFVSLIKTRSVATLLTAVLVIPAIFIQTLISLASNALIYAVSYSNKRDSKATSDLNWANEYINVLTLMVVYLALAIVGVLRPKNATVGYEAQRRKTVGYA